MKVLPPLEALMLAYITSSLHLGGDKIQDAYYIYQELIDKHGATPLLLNGQSASYIGQEKYDEAEAALQEAVEKDPNNVDTLINLIVLAQQTGKSTEVILQFLKPYSALPDKRIATGIYL